MAILGVTITILVTLFLQARVDSMVIDKNEFLLYNKYYHKARLYQFGTKINSFGSWEHGIEDNQLWKFEEHPYKKGCYYISNERYSTYRFAYSQYWKGLIIYGGNYYDDQLWKLVPSGKNDGFYYIENCLYANHKIVKNGPNNNNVGTYRHPAKYDDQLWKLVPRFEVDIFTDEVFHFDNRQGSTDIVREISVTHGVTKSSESSVRNLVSFSQSLTASVEGAGASAESTTEFTTELETTFSSSTESSWSKTETITFTIPAGKNFKVMQHKADFKGVVPQDSCTLLTSIKIFESDTASFSDPDGFVIN